MPQRQRLIKFGLELQFTVTPLVFCDCTISLTSCSRLQTIYRSNFWVMMECKDFLVSFLHTQVLLGTPRSKRANSFVQPIIAIFSYLTKVLVKCCGVVETRSCFQVPRFSPIVRVFALRFCWPVFCEWRDFILFFLPQALWELILNETSYCTCTGERS